MYITMLIYVIISMTICYQVVICQAFNGHLLIINDIDVQVWRRERFVCLSIDIIKVRAITFEHKQHVRFTRQIKYQ